MQQNMTYKIKQVLVHQIAKKANLKSGTDKLEKVPHNLISLKIQVDKLNVDKLVPIPVDFQKISVVIS